MTAVKLQLHRGFVRALESLSENERDSVARTVLTMFSSGITPGMRPHSVGVFLSLSANMDLRIISRRFGERVLLLHVAHHDDAYAWAKRTTLLGCQTHSDVVAVTDVFKAVTEYPNSLPLPVQALLKVDDDALIEGAADLPPEWQEWLMSTRLGHDIPTPTTSSLAWSPVDDSELEAVLRVGWPEWRLFLHPIQREAVNDTTSKSIGVRGAPGTGKTVVLLNRMLRHAPRQHENAASVLLVRDQTLAAALHRTLRDASSRNLYVFPSYFLGGNRPLVEWKRASWYNLVLTDGLLWLHAKHEEPKLVQELLIDEVQDISSDVILNKIHWLLESSHTSNHNIITKCILSFDLDQSVITQRHYFNRKSIMPITHYDLTYCYRSTRQMMIAAGKWRSLMGTSSNTSNTYALSGPKPSLWRTNTEREALRISDSILEELLTRYPKDAICVVFGEYFNPTYSSPFGNPLFKHRRLGDFSQYADKVKGHEFAAGIVYVNKGFMTRKYSSEGERQMRINSLYVALTRFRDEVHVVYQDGGGVSTILDHIND